jgi:hypothetical protein
MFLDGWKPPRRNRSGSLFGRCANFSLALLRSLVLVKLIVPVPVPFLGVASPAAPFFYLKSSDPSRSNLRTEVGLFILSGTILTSHGVAIGDEIILTQSCCKMPALFTRRRETAMNESTQSGFVNLQWFHCIGLITESFDNRKL